MRVKIYIWLKCNVYATRTGKNTTTVKSVVMWSQVSALFKEQEKKTFVFPVTAIKGLEIEVHWDVRLISIDRVS